MRQKFKNKYLKRGRPSFLFENLCPDHRGAQRGGGGSWASVCRGYISTCRTSWSLGLGPECQPPWPTSFFQTLRPITLCAPSLPVEAPAPHFLPVLSLELSLWSQSASTSCVSSRPEARCPPSPRRPCRLLHASASFSAVANTASRALLAANSPLEAKPDLSSPVPPL